MTRERRHTCGRCGRALAEGEYVFSGWTRSRYCLDLKACAKRAARRDRKAGPVPA